jgi:hypothetical protein
VFGRNGRSGRGRRGNALVAAGVAALAVAVAAVSMLAATGQTAAAAAGPCSVSYQVNQWTGGFTANVGVTNNGAAVTAWTLTWSFDGNQKITSAWSAQVTQTGTGVSAVNESYNGSLATGGTATFGFQGTFSGSNDTPANFALNGVSCEGGATSTGTTTTTPPPTTTTTTTAPPTTTTTTPPGGGGCPAGVVFCDGFENQAGTTPSGRWSVDTPSCSGTGNVAISSTVAHSGGKSLQANGFDGYCNHVFADDTTDMATVTSNDWFVRFWMMHTTPLPTGHVTFLAMNDSADGNTDLRLGGQNGALMWNRQLDDQTLPDQSPAGVAQSYVLPTNTWTCVEFEVNGTNGHINTWVNGSAIPGLTENGTPVSNVSDQWVQGNGATWRPHLTDLKLGWESYGGGGNDTLWFDDVALSSSRIGC